MIISENINRNKAETAIEDITDFTMYAVNRLLLLIIFLLIKKSSDSIH